MLKCKGFFGLFNVIKCPKRLCMRQNSMQIKKKLKNFLFTFKFRIMLDLFSLLLMFYLAYGQQTLVTLVKCLPSTTNKNVDVLQNVVWTSPN